LTRPAEGEALLRTSLVILLIALCLAVPRFAGAQSSVATAFILRDTTARITVTNPAARRRGLCVGFVQIVRAKAAFVATAKHCIEEQASGPLGHAASLQDLGLSVVIDYANGTRGRARYLAWNEHQDAIVLVSSFTQLPVSYARLCPGCKIYETVGIRQRIPVESILSAGAGAPVISSGIVESDTFGRYTVILPSSPGTSGAPVLDLRGNLVGIVVSGATFRGADAGWQAGIVLGQTVYDLARYAVEHYPDVP